MKNKSEMIQEVSWLGKYIAFHEIGEYSFVEYKAQMFKSKSVEMYEEISSFAPFINGQRIGRSYSGLDAALVGVIAYKLDGGNTRADEYFMKAIKP